MTIFPRSVFAAICISCSSVLGSSLSLLCASFFYTPPAGANEAENSPPRSATTGWNGTAGAGFISFPRYTGGQQLQTIPIPVLSINYNETFYVEIERIGVYVLASDDKKIGLGLAVEPRFGYNASANQRLAGMATRRNSLEGGLTFDWDFDSIAFSAAWLTDMTKSSRGASIRFSLYRPLLKTNRGEIGIVTSADRMSTATADYFFGVRGNEANLSRPSFSAGAGTTVSIGIGGTYRTGIHSALIFGANIGKLAKSVARSPIVENNRSQQIYLGYGWAL